MDIYHIIEKDVGVTIIAYRIFQAIAALTFVFLSGVTVYCTIKKLHFSDHTTTKIIATFYQFTKIAQSALIFTVTTLLLDGHYSVVSLPISCINGFITLSVIKLRLYPFLVTIDVLLKSSKIKNYGYRPLSVGLTIILILATIIISLGFQAALLLFSNLENFILIFSLNITAVQLCNALLSIYLYKIVKEMRRKSVFSSSLAERHMCSKNLEMLEYFLPETLICFFCGCMALVVTFIVNYVLHWDIITGFALCFMWFEIGSLASTANGILLSLNIRLFFNNGNSIVNSEMTSKISTAQTTSVYFQNLHRSWNH